MKTTIDYSNRETPAFDAVEDIKSWLGDRYDTVRDIVKGITDAQTFGLACGFAGIEGAPVRYWYDHFHGQGAYDKWWDEGGPDVDLSREEPLLDRG